MMKVVVMQYISIVMSCHAVRMRPFHRFILFVVERVLINTNIPVVSCLVLQVLLVWQEHQEFLVLQGHQEFLDLLAEQVL
jgi:hypothetical protein